MNNECTEVLNNLNENFDRRRSNIKAYYRRRRQIQLVKLGLAVVALGAAVTVAVRNHNS